MKLYLMLLSVALCFLQSSHAASTPAFYGDPPDANHPWAIHDMNRPHPLTVVPGDKPGDAPSDAIVLFDGTYASFNANWRHIGPEQKHEEDWTVVDGYMHSPGKTGDLASKVEPGDIQLHLEWFVPKGEKGSGQGRGNSGVFLMGLFEVQVLDNYENPTYPDGTAGALYGVMPPAVNALRPQGSWQVYDIIFRRPILRNKQLLEAGSLTVLCNGVVVQASTPIERMPGFRKRSALPEDLPDVGPLVLQDHAGLNRFRNIWYRNLRPRPIDGGLDGTLSTEVTIAVRAAIAEKKITQALQSSGLDKGLLLLESLVYKFDTATYREADQLVNDYLNAFKTMSHSVQDGEKSSMIELYKAYNYLIKFEIIPRGNTTIEAIFSILKEKGWVKQREAKR